MSIYMPMCLSIYAYMHMCVNIYDTCSLRTHPSICSI